MDTFKDRRHKIEEREQIEDYKKDTIAEKSSCRCVWCGKKTYFKYGGTLDHFVPLKKGGTNDDANLVMMCYECNQKKGSRVIPPIIAAKYLNQPYRQELDDYFDNYEMTFDYMSRGNLLCCDMYEVRMVPEVLWDVKQKAKKRGKKIKSDNMEAICYLTRVYPDDIEKITEYYIKYLRKYDKLHSEEAARCNIKFWLRFGAIYFIQRAGEISVMATVLMSRHGFMSMNLFAMYSTTFSASAARGIVTAVSKSMIYENNLPYLPVSVNMLGVDPLYKKVLLHTGQLYSNGNLICVPYIVPNQSMGLSYDEAIKRKPEIDKFMSRFKDVEEDVNTFLYQNDMLSYSWMADEILERDMFVEIYGEPILSTILQAKENFSRNI